MPFVKLTRVLPDGTYPVAINTDMILWIEQVNGKVTLMAENCMEIDVTESFQAVLSLLGMEE